MYGCHAMANVIEEAKSGRASCRTCKKAIAKGELRLGIEVQTQFSDTPSLAWHHVLCAASKLPAELKEALDAYGGEVPNRVELDKAMDDAIRKGGAKPGGFPYIDRAPTGRAKCMQCDEAIEKGSLRVAVERELEIGGNVTRGAGYLHPRCVAENLENVGGSAEELIEGLRKNSRIPPEDLDAVVAEIGGGAAAEPPQA
jgi:poly [ADP-ribose] polymerase